jgi:uncharacterized damage-inducible protein DinB
MDNFVRQDPPLAADEKTMLEAFLDYHRATLLMKVSGVSDDDLRRKPTVSSMTLLGLVKHIAYVERWWFQAVFAGQEVEFPWSDDDPDGDWRVEPDDTTEGIIELYKAEVQKSREIVAAASLDEMAKQFRLGRSLRWIVLHMIEETARHNGHADILREAIDGVTGE